MTLKQALAANRWLRAQLACLIAVALCLPAMVVFASAWVLFPFAVFALTGGVCWVPARRLERALKCAHDRAAADARELRTPRVPDAGPGQCTVCGMDDLDALAKDDRFMERGERSKVVAYGSRRAHRDCAEFVPYVPTEADRRPERHDKRSYATGRISASDFNEEMRRIGRHLADVRVALGELAPPFYRCSCHKCGEIGRAKTLAERDAILEEHRRTYWKIPRIELRDKQIG